MPPILLQHPLRIPSCLILPVLCQRDFRKRQEGIEIIRIECENFLEVLLRKIRLSFLEE